MNFKTLALAARPQTLTAILGPILVGFFLAQKLAPETLQVIYLIPILISGLSIQIATNLFNDYLDFKKGGDREDRLGPVRVTANALMDSRQVKLWALTFCGIALMAGIPIVLKTGWIFVILGLLSLVLSYLYTGTKYSLAYTGLADLFVILFFGGFAVWGTFYTLTLSSQIWPFYLGLQLGCLSTILLVINNLRDVKQDRFNNKKTLIVRFGRQFGLTYYLLLISIGYLSVFLWPEHIFNFKFLLILSPWFLFQIYFWNWVKKNEPSKAYNLILKFTSLTFFGTCLSLCIGFLLF